MSVAVMKVPPQFPVGTSVSAYPDTGQQPSGPPAVAALETHPVDASSVLTFTSLASSTRYWAGAPISGVWLYFAFTTPAAAVGLIGLGDLGFDVATQAELDASVVNERLNVTHAPYNAARDDTGDQAAAINQAITDAGNAVGGNGGTVYAPAGTYRSPTASIIVPRDKPVNLIGEGPNNTIFDFPVDLGAGTYAIGRSGTDAGLRHRFEDFRVRGPNVGAGVGVDPASMKGIMLVTADRLTRVASAGTHAGVDFQGDHIQLRSCDLAGYYSILFGTKPGGGLVTGRGDSVVDCCDLTGATRASLGITTANAIEGGLFSKTHFGFSPYGIELIDDASNRFAATQIGVCLFDGCSFEQIGNCGIVDNTPVGYGGLVSLRFVNSGGPNQSDTYRIGANPKDYAIDVKQLVDLVIEGGSGITGGFCTEPFVVGTMRLTQALDNLEWRQAQTALDTANNTGKPLFDFTGTAVASGVMYGGRVICGLARNEVGSVAAGDLVEWADYQGVSRVQKYIGGGGGIPAGVAYNARAAGKIVPVAMSGQVLANVDAGTAVRSYLKPSATSGKMVAGIATDQPRVGISVTAESGGQLRAHLAPPGGWPS